MWNILSLFVACFIYIQAFVFICLVSVSVKNLMWCIGTHVIGNSVNDQPWQKVIKGQEKFEEIVSRHRRECASTQLREDLIRMLSDTNRYDMSLQLLSCFEHRLYLRLLVLGWRGLGDRSSVRLSDTHAYFVTKWKNTQLKFWHHMKG